MESISKIEEVRDKVSFYKTKYETVGFVPTMGYLHAGHMSLVRAAKNTCDRVVVSIFVNPSQFGPKEDFSTYPMDMEADLKMCRDAGVDVVFSPEAGDMYPRGIYDLGSGALTFVEPVAGLTDKLCGESRPGHFRGVATIVAKLLNIVTPHYLFMGQKDAQQLAVIENMVTDLNIGVKVIPCPIVREEDGLAMSSRNTYLSREDRISATVLNRSLQHADKMIKDGVASSSAIIEEMTKIISSEKNAEIDYIEIVDAASLERVETPKGDTLIALAVKFGKTRLIDNMRLVI
jgi:pantoate--beta-alanine ligase